MKSTLLLFISVTLILTLTGIPFARIINVPNDVETIQGAIDESEDGDTVLVQPGRYVENINFNGRNIVVGSLFLTTGDEDHIPRTIIDGGANGRSVIAIRLGESPVITGFTVTNAETDYGGGFYIRDSSPTLSHLIVTGNIVERNGAGIYCTSFSSPTIDHVLITDNSCGYVGGGFGCYGGSTPTLTNCVIVNNYSDHCGGGLHAYNSELTLERVTVSRNRALHTGGAIYLTENATANISDCILWENDPHEIQLAFNIDHELISISHSDVDDGLGGIFQFGDGAVDWGMGNIDLDPQFENPEGGDFHLTEDSPCIDAGNPESEPDPDGTRTDMGALYFHNEDGQHVLHVPDAFDTIQEAIDDADDGDIILVQPGEYVENINFDGKEITVGSLFLSTGNEEYITETVIDGDFQCSVVTFENREGEDAVLTGLTIRNGQGTEWWDDDWDVNTGGGIFCHFASPTLSNLVITENWAEYGGGICIWRNSFPLVRNVRITDNSGLLGGGIFCYLRSRPTFTYSVVSDNTAGEGGAIFCYSLSHPTISNCTISGNSSEDGGGGIRRWDGCASTLVNTILWNNSPQEISFSDRDDPNNITISYSDVEGGEDGIELGDNGEVEWGEGNIDSDPLFVDADNGDFHLSENSPCINAGDRDSPRDPDGTRADMGALYLYHEIIRENILMYVPDDYETIQDGIDASIAGDTILVRPGTYVENIDFLGKDIVVGSLFLTTGDVAYIDSTVIDGDGVDAVVTLNRMESEAAVLNGFQIRNGSSQEGGGIYCFHSSPTIAYCAVYGNEAESGGGGVFCYEGSPALRNCTISNNSVDEGGGGLFCWSNASPVLINTIIWDNTSPQIYFGEDRDYNSIRISYSDVEGGEDGIETNNNAWVNWRDGNIDSDPLFVDAEGDNYHLTEDSPCMNTGDPESLRDPDGTRADMGAFFCFDNSFTIQLRSGWSLISSPVPPPDNDMLVIWADLVERGRMIIIKDHLGRFYWPEWSYNDIPFWDVHYGYHVKMSRADSLYIENEPVPEDEPITLEDGWSIAAYFPVDEVPVREAFANVEGVLYFVKDGLGRFYVPSMDFSNMGLLRRGQGYQVNVTDDAELVWNVPDRIAFSTRDVQIDPVPVHFTAPAPTGCNMSILIMVAPPLTPPLLSRGGIKGGVEIGAFNDGGLCVGAAATRGNGPYGMAVWGDDPTSDVEDGMKEGEPIHFRLWDGDREVDLPQPPLLRGDQGGIKGGGNPVYTTDGFLVTSLTINENLPSEFAIASVYPNPFNAMTTISYQLPEASEVTIKIYDIQGREIVTLINDKIKAGYYNAVWNAVEFPSGLYICRMEAGSSFSKSLKLVLTK